MAAKSGTLGGLNHNAATDPQAAMTTQAPERPVEIRCYQDSDHDAVVALWRQVFEYRDPHQTPEIAIRNKRAQGDDLLLVAVAGACLIGTVMGGYDGHRGWIYSLAVAPSLRRRGVARALLDQLEWALAGRGCMKVNLQVLDGNDRAVAFYRAAGYRVEARVSMGKHLYQ